MDAVGGSTSAFRKASASEGASGFKKRARTLEI